VAVGTNGLTLVKLVSGRTVSTRVCSVLNLLSQGLNLPPSVVARCVIEPHNFGNLPRMVHCHQSS
jgi:hypothetical protein